MRLLLLVVVVAAALSTVESSSSSTTTASATAGGTDTVAPATAVDACLETERNLLEESTKEQEEHSIFDLEWNELDEATRREWQAEGHYELEWENFGKDYRWYYLSAWDELTPNQQDALQQLNWTPELWQKRYNEGYCVYQRPLVELRCWSRLTADEQAAATQLGFDEYTWHTKNVEMMAWQPNDDGNDAATHHDIIHRPPAVLLPNNGFQPMLLTLNITEFASMTFDRIAQAKNEQLLIVQDPDAPEAPFGNDETARAIPMTAQEFVEGIRQHGKAYYIKYEDDRQDAIQNILQLTTGGSSRDDDDDLLDPVTILKRYLLQDTKVADVARIGPKYEREECEEYLQLYVGGPSSITNMHLDIQSFNFLYVVQGRKRIRLLPNDQRYATNFTLGLEAHYSVWTGFDLLNVNPIPEHGVEFILEAGQGVSVPYHTWHAVENLEPTIAFGLIRDFPYMGPSKICAGAMNWLKKQQQEKTANKDDEQEQQNPQQQQQQQQQIPRPQQQQQQYQQSYHHHQQYQHSYHQQQQQQQIPPQYHYHQQQYYQQHQQMPPPQYQYQQQQYQYQYQQQYQQQQQQYYYHQQQQQQYVPPSLQQYQQAPQQQLSSSLDWFDEADWSDLTNRQRELLSSVLGWTQEDWDTTTSNDGCVYRRPLVETRSWSRMLPEEQDAAAELGFTAQTWHSKEFSMTAYQPRRDGRSIRHAGEIQGEPAIVLPNNGFHPITMKLDIDELAQVTWDVLEEKGSEIMIEVQQDPGDTNQAAMGNDETVDTLEMTVSDFAKGIKEGKPYYAKLEYGQVELIGKILGPNADPSELLAKHLEGSLVGDLARLGPKFAGEQAQSESQLYIGGKGSSTNMHLDWQSFNFLYVVTGRKRIRLLPNDQRYASNFTVGLEAYYSVWTGYDLLHADPIPEHGVELILGPGEGVSVPYHTWHTVENLEPTIAVGLIRDFPFTSLHKVCKDDGDDDEEEEK